MSIIPIKVRSVGPWPECKNAHCRNCGWDTYEDTASSKARYHSGKTGHTVDVYIEVRRTVRPLNEKEIIEQERHDKMLEGRKQ